MLRPETKLILFMEGALGELHGKMGTGILRYSKNPVVAIIDTTAVGSSVEAKTGIQRNIPIVATLEEAIKLGGEALVLGIAPPGGQIPATWFRILDEAISQGVSLINGLHDRLSLRYPTLKPGQFVWDIRVEPAGLDINHAKAAKLDNRRVLMIGTDMAIGKMTAGLEIYRRANERGLRTEFVATGQIGITLTGRGVPLDAVRVDYASGAIEREVLACKDASLVIVEGQGSLINPASTANLPLLRGTQPTHLILCHRAGLTHLQRFQEIQIPPLDQFWTLYEDLAEACGTFKRPQTVAICLNTAHLTPSQAEATLKQTEDRYGLPTVDPVRSEPDRIVDLFI